MASEKNLQQLFHETLKDIYFAEKKILSALPKMAKAAQSQELKAAFEKHETETKDHVARLEEIFDEIGERPRGKTCDAIMGIIEEGQEVMKEFKGAPALDAGLLGAAQAVEHYEIARFGTLKTWASELGLSHAVRTAGELPSARKRRPTKRSLCLRRVGSINTRRRLDAKARNIGRPPGADFASWFGEADSIDRLLFPKTASNSSTSTQE